MTDVAGGEDGEFERLLGYLEEEMGFAADYYKPAYLRRRVRSRLRRTELGVDDYGAYRRRLAEDADERAALRDALSVNVTEFFRNEDVWADLRGVLRDLSDRGRPVRAWSAACSDGREPYSLAMLAASDRRAGEVDVLATDIDEAALERARRARYRSSDTTDVRDELSFLSRPLAHVTREDDGDTEAYAVDPSVADRVRFERHDLIRDDPKEGFDLALCRNVLIYVEPAYKHAVLETLTASLSPGGVLVIGKTERLPPEFDDRYDPVHTDTRIYRRVGDD